MGIKLTDGAISTIMNGVDVDKPIVQLLSYKKLPGSANRYRLVLSDGVHFVTAAILTCQLNHLIESGTLDKNAVVTLDNFVINNVSQENRKIIIILSLSICVSGETMGMTLGTPTQLQETGASDNPPPDMVSLHGVLKEILKQVKSQAEEMKAQVEELKGVKKELAELRTIKQEMARWMEIMTRDLDEEFSS